jgi:carbon monoxide dehydrogenase subunit G
MTVRVERSTDVAAPPERVWEFIADPERRAQAISVVASYTIDGDGATWNIELPIPLVNRTIAVETREIDREPPRFVKFVGRSAFMRVVGEHEIEPTGSGSRVTSRFVVDGKLPGVEAYFEKNLDRELANLESELRTEVES